MTIKVDGRCAGYSRLLTCYTPTAVFSHFLTTVKAQNMEEMFLFGAPELTEPVESASTSKATAQAELAKSSPAGLISVDVSLAREFGDSGSTSAQSFVSKAPLVKQLEGALLNTDVPSQCA